MQIELDVQGELTDKLKFELAEVRERLRKREDEVRELKMTLNGQIDQVETEYRMQIEEFREQNLNLVN